MHIHNQLVTTIPDADQLAEWRAMLEHDGILFLPKVAATVDHVELSRRFGELVPQYDGALVWDIRPQPAHEGHYHSLNTRPLAPHTDYYEVPGRPHRYQALWCVAPATDGGGATLLADGYTFIDGLEPDARAFLESNQFRFVSTPGIQATNMGSIAEHPIVERDPDGTIIRFTMMCMEIDEARRAPTSEIRQRWLDTFAGACVRVEWTANAWLIWDNWRVLHSRTGFSDVGRHLRRVFLDATRRQHERSDPDAPLPSRPPCHR